MALESPFASAPPQVGHANNDTQNGEIQSDYDQDDEHIGNVDLEEGEIVDSGNEFALDDDEDVPRVVKKLGASQAKKHSFEKKSGPPSRKSESLPKKKKKKRKTDEVDFPNKKTKRSRYIDHDHVDDDESLDCGLHRGRDRSRSPASYESPRRSPSRGSPSKGHRSSSSMSSSHRKGSLDKKLKKKKKIITRTIDKKSSRFKPKRKERSICKFFKDGKCSKGADCDFFHERPIIKKPDLCKFYLNGYCGKGTSCLFMHDEFPCKFYHTGAICFADTKCRFSHAPLDDEGRHILDRYLDGGYKEPEPPLMREELPPPEQMSPPRGLKRPSLLGSPPRHVKEAAESWRFQMRQQRGKGRDMFPRMPMMGPPPFNPNMNSPPGPFPRPSFYVDTLQQSPNKSQMPPNSGPPLPPPMHGFMGMPPPGALHMGPMMCNEPGFMMGGPPGMCMDQPPPMGMMMEPAEIDSASGNESEVPEPLMMEPPIKTIPEGSENPSIESVGSPPQMPNLLPQVPPCIPEDNPNVAPLLASEAGITPLEMEPQRVPFHLPRRQRELFLRIQQQQKSNVDGLSDTGETSQDSDVPAPQHENIKEPEPSESRALEESSGDDDDDTDDQPLTAVLKKLQREPPAKTMVEEAPKTTSTPALDISKMLSTIRQQVPSQPQSEFWQQLFASTVPVTSESQQSSSTANRDPRLARSVSQTSSLVLPSVSSASAKTTEVPTTRDPRLRDRLGKPETSKALETVLIESRAGDAPYRIHKIEPSRPNYQAYFLTVKGDTNKLQKDPRLKKFFSGKIIPVDPVKEDASPAVEAPAVKVSAEESVPRTLPIPRRDPRTAAHSAADGLQQKPVEEQQRTKLEEQKPRIADPRRAATLANAAESSPPSTSATSTPVAPLLPTPPVRVNPTAPPVRVNPPTPPVRINPPAPPVRVDSPAPPVRVDSPAPPARVDPRLARRQEQAATSNENSSASTVQTPKEVEEVKSAAQSRKDRMDYSSPLDSYNKVPEKLGYNNYNRRPQPRPQVTVPNTTTAVSLPTPPPLQAVPPTIPASLTTIPVTDSLVNVSPQLMAEVQQMSVTSLKDMFKTIDPTASPFC